MATIVNAERKRLGLSKFRIWRDSDIAPATVERFFGPNEERISPGAVRLATALETLHACGLDLVVVRRSGLAPVEKKSARRK